MGTPEGVRIPQVYNIPEYSLGNEHDKYPYMIDTKRLANALVKEYKADATRDLLAPGLRAWKCHQVHVVPKWMKIIVSAEHILIVGSGTKQVQYKLSKDSTEWVSHSFK